MKTSVGRLKCVAYYKFDVNYCIYDMDDDKSESIESILSVCHRQIVEQCVMCNKRTFCDRGISFQWRLRTICIISIRDENR